MRNGHGLKAENIKFENHSANEIMENVLRI